MSPQVVARLLAVAEMYRTFVQTDSAGMVCALDVSDDVLAALCDCDQGEMSQGCWVHGGEPLNAPGCPEWTPERHCNGRRARG